MCIDPASNECGVTLWYLNPEKAQYEILASKTLSSLSSKQPYSQRLLTIRNQLGSFLEENGFSEESPISFVVCEGVRSRLVQVSLGAFLALSSICVRLHPQHSFIEATSWKAFARSKGATGPLKDIKGLKALEEIGWKSDVEIKTDDEADSVLIFLTWETRNGIRRTGFKT